MSAITTHVLDAVLGKPAAGIAVRLERRQDSGGCWPVQRAQQMQTDAAAIWRSDANEGCLPTHLSDAAHIWRDLGRASIYPEISITFHLRWRGALSSAAAIER